MNGTVKTLTTQDGPDMARQVADRIQELSRSGEGPVTIALSGGSTPQLLYETLAAPPYQAGVDWKNMVLFFGDERSVPADHEESNYRMAREALLDKVDVLAHRMLAAEGQAEAYELLLNKTIRTKRNGVPVLDVVLLGMGADGHTASLFPHTTALHEKDRLVVMNEVPQKQTLRMTFTYPLLNAARHIWILCCGSGKQEMLRNCLPASRSGDLTHRNEWPIVAVQPAEGELVWWLDQAAAG